MTAAFGYWISMFLVPTVSITLLFSIDIMLTKSYDKGIILLVANLIAFASVNITSGSDGRASSMTWASLSSSA